MSFPRLPNVRKIVSHTGLLEGNRQKRRSTNHSCNSSISSRASSSCLRRAPRICLECHRCLMPWRAITVEQCDLDSGDGPSIVITPQNALRAAMQKAAAGTSEQSRHERHAAWMMWESNSNAARCKATYFHRSWLH